MNETIEAGSHCILKRDVVVDDQLAFMTGDSVVVDSVSPADGRRVKRYLVYSRVIDRKLFLTDADLQLVRGAYWLPDAPGVDMDVVPAGSPSDIFAGETDGATVFATDVRLLLSGTRSAGKAPSSKKWWLVGAACVVLAAIVVVLILTVGSSSAKAPPGVPTDWKGYSAGGVQMWMPPYYQVGYSSGDLNSILSKTTNQAPEFQLLMPLVGQTTTGTILFGIDPDPTSTAANSTVDVLENSVPAGGLTLGDVMTAGTLDVPAGYNPVSSTVVTL